MELERADGCSRISSQAEPALGVAFGFVSFYKRCKAVRFRHPAPERKPALMNVLTWHGAVVRLDTRRNRLVQDPLWLSNTDGH